MQFKMLSAQLPPFHLGVNVLRKTSLYNSNSNLRVETTKYRNVTDEPN